MKRFKKVYVEITNICNLRCSFCPETSRAKKLMGIDEFSYIVSQIKPFTDYIYFHLMGEPFLNTNLKAMLDICGEAGLKVNITTNGTLINKVSDTLLNAPALRKVSFSLHSFEANYQGIRRDKFVGCQTPDCAIGDIPELKQGNGYCSAQEQHDEAFHSLEQSIENHSTPKLGTGDCATLEQDIASCPALGIASCSAQEQCTENNSTPEQCNNNYSSDEQIPGLSSYLSPILDFVNCAAKKGIICELRLWNQNSDNSSLNNTILHAIQERIDTDIDIVTQLSVKPELKLTKNIYVGMGEKFDWPDINIDAISKEGFCYGLRDQIGILVDGTVVPCCLDSEGTIELGNIFKQPLSDIIASERATAIYEGFSNRMAKEELCQKCGYAGRFSK